MLFTIVRVMDGLPYLIYLFLIYLFLIDLFQRYLFRLKVQPGHNTNL